MLVQNLLVAWLVLVCFGYALWTMGPTSARNRLAAKLLTLPCPLWLQTRLQTALRQQGGCGSCGGCAGKVTRKSPLADGAAKADYCGDAAGPATQLRPLVFHPIMRSVLGAKCEGNQ